MIVDTENVLREADGPVEGSTKKLDSGGKVIAPGCARESVPEKPAGSPKIISGNYRRTTWSDCKRQQISELQLGKFPNPESFFAWKILFETQVTTCSDFPSDAMLWMKEVEMVDPVDELKSSRSTVGRDFPNFKMLDAKISSALKKIIQNSQFKKKVSIEEQKAPKRGPVSTRKTDRFHDLRLLSSDWCS